MVNQRLGSLDFFPLAPLSCAVKALNVYMRRASMNRDDHPIHPSIRQARGAVSGTALLVPCLMTGDLPRCHGPRMPRTS